ncbi:hypothetical protein [Pseudonocardia sp. 73-21]|uniref:hypothetical protein n=1 Tax=Pseudonocardia sp. 73-21 TaxID=1895809 RepID=UPI002613E02E|nr:hypothetical protein [Pseudonocardia sp. 73-21]
MQRKPLVIALVLAVAAGAVLVGGAAAETRTTRTTLTSSAYNRGWEVPSADAIAALDR